MTNRWKDYIQYRLATCDPSVAFDSEKRSFAISTTKKYRLLISLAASSPTLVFLGCKHRLAQFQIYLIPSIIAAE